MRKQVGGGPVLRGSCLSSSAFYNHVRIPPSVARSSDFSRQPEMQIKKFLMLTQIYKKSYMGPKLTISVFRYGSNLWVRLALWATDHQYATSIDKNLRNTTTVSTFTGFLSI